MEIQVNAITFKNNPLSLLGPKVKVGDSAPDFACVSPTLEVVRMSQTPAKARMFSVVPSLDTPVCSIQTKKFDEAIAALGDKVACYTVSLDLPFAQKRFCASEHVANMQSLSDVRDGSFGLNWGVRAEGLSFPLLARAVFVVDKGGKVTYTEVVKAIGDHPNYDAALAALKAVAG
jgi:thiol peroxidase